MEPHLVHADGFAAAIEGERAAGWAVQVAADLGSGGGLPGLPLVLHFPAVRWVLVEAGARRAAFLRRAVAALAVEDRVEVREERAEVSGRVEALRAGVDLVVTRSFGRPAVVAECAAPLLRRGGRLVVSEPPGGQDERWPPDGLAVLGLRSGPTVVSGAGTFQVVEQVDVCPDRFPRRVGVPAKRPLF